MCGIVGIMAPGLLSDKQLAMFKTMLFLDEVRGAHATGIVKVQPWKKEVTTFKKAISATKFLADEEANKFMDEARGRIYIGHNRYATVGDKAADANAHPFVQDHISMVHNGGVDSWTMDKLTGYDDPNCIVDSHHVAKTIAEKGIEDTVPLLSGAFALVWWDDKEKSLNFIRNRERPLWLAETGDNCLLWASEREFMDAFVLRKKNNISYKSEPQELPVDRLITFKFNEQGVLSGMKPTAKELKFTRVPDPKPISYYRGNQNSNYYGSGSVHNGSRTIPAWEMKANGLLRMAKVSKRIGDDITFRVTELETTQNPEKVNVHGTFDNLDVVCYYVDKKKVEGSNRLRGTISNATEIRFSHDGFEFTEPRIHITNDSLVRVLASNSVPHRLHVPTAIGPHFPLKAQGHTFQTKAEFVDFVSQGCSICHDSPVSHDARNTSMTIYETANFQGLLKDCEFVCGKCVLDTEPKKK